MEDILLINQAKEGNKESIDKLIKSRGPKMYKVAFCYVKNEALALEVVSEATFKAYVSIGKLKNPEYFDTWLCRIVINEALGLLKKQKKVVSLDEYREMSSKEESVKIEEKVDLYNALDKLKKDEKEILIMKYFGDLTFDGISKVLGKSENTIKTKHYRALNKVKAILEGV